MFRHLFASVFVAFSLLPQTVEPLHSGPPNVVTRAEAATALLLSRNPNVAVIKNTYAFPDIKKGDWFEPYMLAAERFGIVKADPTTHRLRPTDPVSRVEFLKMLAFTFNVPTGYPHTFKDVPKDAWYSEYVGMVLKFHLPLSDDLTHLQPTEVVTPDQALVSIQIFLRLYNQSQSSFFDEQQLAMDQARNNLKLYTIISTKQTNAVFMATKPAPTVTLKPIIAPPSLPELRTRIVVLVNSERLKANLRPLVYNNLLEQSAQTYAEKMVKEGFFGHVSPQGETVKDRIAATGFYNRSFSPDCNCVKGFELGENLGRGQKTADEVMEDWMNSPTHRAAILNPDYTDIGIGASAGLWVQHFGGVLLPGHTVANR